MEGAQPGAGDAETVCPTCQGRLTVSDLDGFVMFRCHVGHAFSLQSISAEQADEVERALWAAIRALDEAAALSNRLVASTSGRMREKFAEKGSSQRAHANVIRQIVFGGNLLSRDDAFETGEASPPPRKSASTPKG
jgi:two-component system chemotaxis response regulator CheB